MKYCIKCFLDKPFNEFYNDKYSKDGVSVEKFHVDHYIPISKGGKHEKSNLRISCSRCNFSKGGRIPQGGTR